MLLGKSVGIIGARGIGKIYLREILNLGVKKIFLLGKSYQNTLKIKSELEKSLSSKIIACKSLKELKRRKPDFVCICAPTDTHLGFIEEFLKTKTKLLVEKPLFDLGKLSLQEVQSKINLVLNNYSNKLITNLPLIEYTKSLKSKFNINQKGIKSVYFKYYTSGKNTYQDIAIDLLPHSLSFLLFFFSIKTNDIKINYRKMKKDTWKISFSFRKIKCLFDFNQNTNRGKSILKISLNNRNFLRVQKKNITRYIKNEEYIRSGKLIKKIENPMSKSIKQNFKKLIRNKINKKDVELQKSLILLSAFLLNKK